MRCMYMYCGVVRTYGDDVQSMMDTDCAWPGIR